MMQFEYFTFPGSLDVVVTVFKAVAMFTRSGMMASAALAAALFGFLVTLAVAVYKLDLKDSFVNLMVIGLIWMGVMTPRVTVLVTEGAGVGHTGKQYAVGGIPLGLAAMGHLVSEFGYRTTQNMEKFYRMPDDLNYSRTGIVFGARLYEQIRSANVKDSVLVRDWALFMNQCSFYDLNMYHFYTVDELRNSQDILATLGKTNQVLFTTVTNGGRFNRNQLVYDQGTTTKTCKEAYQILRARTQNLIGNVTVPATLARVLGSLNTQDSIAQTALVNLSNRSFQYLLDQARFDTVKNIEQVAMADIIRQSRYINAQRNRNTATIQQAFAQAQARNQYITSQKTGAVMASWNLPLVRAAAEAVLIGLFPLVILMALMAGVMAFRMIGFYFMSLLWIQLWGPVASIINLLLTIHTKKLLSLEAPTGVITAGSVDTLWMAAADAQSAAGVMMWLVPVIAGALAMGGRSMMSGLMGAAAAGKATAEKAGQDIGTGNINAGNMSYNNANANKHSLNPVYTDTGMIEARSLGGTSWADMKTGESRHMQRTDSYVVGGKAEIGMSEAYTTAADKSMTAGHQQLATAQEAYSTGSAQTMAWAAQYASGHSADTGYGLGLDASESQKMSAVMKASEELAKKHGLSTTSDVTSALMGSLGGGIGSALIRLGGSLREEVKNNDKLQSDISQAAKSLKEQGVTFDQSTADKISQTEAFKSSVSDHNSLAHQASANFSRAETASLSAQRSFAEAQSYREQAAASQSSGATVSVDLGRYVGQSGLTSAEVYRNPTAAAGQVMEAATATVAGLKQQADGTSFAASTDIRSSDKPQNHVSAAHQQNVQAVQSAAGSQFESVANQAARAGMSADSVANSLERTQQSLSGRFSQARVGAEQSVSEGESTYHGQVGNLIKQTQQMARSVDSLAMRANSKQTDTNTAKAQQEVRSGEGLAGSGYDNVFANVVDNPHLKDGLQVQKPRSIVDMPGNSRSSGSAVYHPKKD